MTEFVPDKKHFKGSRRSLVLQAICGFGAFPPTLLAFLLILGSGDLVKILNAGTGLFFATLALVAAMMAIREIRQPVRDRIRILITANTLVIRYPCDPPRYLNRRDCVTFKPWSLQFRRQNGKIYHLGVPGLPWAASHELCTFVFTHWWSKDMLDAIRKDFNAELPPPPRTAWWYTLAIVLTAVVALFLLTQMPGSKALPGPLAAIALLVVLRSPYAAERRAWKKARKECEYTLPTGEQRGGVASDWSAVSQAEKAYVE